MAGLGLHLKYRLAVSQANLRPPGQWSRTRRRSAFVSDRWRLSSRRRWRAPADGRRARRGGGGGAKASRSRSANRSRAATRLRNWERCSDAETVIRPSTSRPASALRPRERWVSVKAEEFSRSNSNSTLLSVVFTDWPPGPDEREKRSFSSAAGRTRPWASPGPGRTCRSSLGSLIGPILAEIRRRSGRRRGGSRGRPRGSTPVGGCGHRCRPGACVRRFPRWRRGRRSVSRRRQHRRSLPPT